MSEEEFNSDEELIKFKNIIDTITELHSQYYTINQTNTNQNYNNTVHRNTQDKSRVNDFKRSFFTIKEDMVSNKILQLLNNNILEQHFKAMVDVTSLSKGVELLGNLIEYCNKWYYSFINDNTQFDTLQQDYKKLQDYQEKKDNLENGIVRLEEKYTQVATKLGVIDRTYEETIKAINNKVENLSQKLDSDAEKEIKEFIDIKLEPICSNQVDSFIDTNLTTLSNNKLDDKIQGFLDNKDEYFKSSVTKYLNKQNIEIDEIKATIKELMGNVASTKLGMEYQERKKWHGRTYYSFLGLFITCIILSSWYMFDFIKPLLGSGTSIITNSIEFLPVYMLVLWVLIFINKTVNQEKKLSQIYTHKSVVAITYVGLRDELGKITDDELSNNLKNLLLEEMIKTNGKDPAEILDSGSNYPLSEMFKLVNKKNVVDVLNSDIVKKNIFNSNNNNNK